MDTQHSSSSTLNKIIFPYVLKIILPVALLVVLLIWFIIGFVLYRINQEFEASKINTAIDIAHFLENSYNARSFELLPQFIAELQTIEELEEQSNMLEFSASFEELGRVPQTALDIMRSEPYLAISNALMEIQSEAVARYTAVAPPPNENETRSFSRIISDIPLLYIAINGGENVNAALLRIVADSDLSLGILESEGSSREIVRRYWSGRYFDVGEFFPFTEALAGRIAVTQLYDTAAILTVAIPIVFNAAPVAILAGDIDYRDANLVFQEYLQNYLYVGLTTTAVGIVIVIVLAFWLARPIRKLRKDAMRLANHDLSTRPYTKSHDEFSQIVKSINLFLEHTLRGNEELYRTAQAYRSVFPRVYLDLLGKEDLGHLMVGEYAERTMTILLISLYDNDAAKKYISPRDTINSVSLVTSIIENIVRKNRGAIDSISERSIVTFFPVWSQGALDSAVEICRALSKEDFLQKGAGCTCVMGIHYGPVAFGMVGGKSIMRIITVAETIKVANGLVNIASQIGARIVITQHYLESLANFFRYQTRYLGNVPIGASSSVIIYEIIDAYEEELKRMIMTTRLDFEEGIKCYESNSIARAQEIMNTLYEHNTTDKVASFFTKQLLGKANNNH